MDRQSVRILAKFPSICLSYFLSTVFFRRKGACRILCEANLTLSRVPPHAWAAPSHSRTCYRRTSAAGRTATSTTPDAPAGRRTVTSGPHHDVRSAPPDAATSGPHRRTPLRQVRTAGRCTVTSGPHRRMLHRDVRSAPPDAAPLRQVRTAGRRTVTSGPRRRTPHFRRHPARTSHLVTWRKMCVKGRAMVLSTLVP